MGATATRLWTRRGDELRAAQARCALAFGHGGGSGARNLERSFRDRAPVWGVRRLAAGARADRGGCDADLQAFDAVIRGRRRARGTSISPSRVRGLRLPAGIPTGPVHEALARREQSIRA